MKSWASISAFASASAAMRRIVGLIVVLDAAAERVRHQVLRERADERRRALDQRALRAPRGSRSACRRRAGRACRPASRSRAIRHWPDDIEVVEREADRIHVLMARLALRIGAVLLHPLARREQPALLGVRRSSRDRARWAAAVAAASRAALPSPTCRAAPATCGSPATSASARCPARAARGGDRPDT